MRARLKRGGLMEKMTVKQRKIAVICTVTGVILLLFALIALVYNLVSIGTLSSRRSELEAQSEQLSAAIEENENEFEYMQSSEYIEKYAREHLNMKYEDEEVYVPE